MSDQQQEDDCGSVIGCGCLCVIGVIMLLVVAVIIKWLWHLLWM